MRGEAAVRNKYRGAVDMKREALRGFPEALGEMH
jgi:hypothetical protein